MNTIKHIGELSAEKRARHKEHLESEKGIAELAGARAIRSAPLSFAQQRLWFLDQLEPGSPFYNMPAAFHLKGALDIAALERCFSEIQRRHEVLRTRFIAADDEALQVIQAAPDFELSIIDLASLAPSSREAEALRFAHEEATKPFSLSCGPVFRAHLAKLAADDHVLTINLHHIVSDNWSLVVLYRELAALYDEYTTGSESQLAELSIQYADYALWQRERLKGRLVDEQLAYWKAQLKGAPALLELPIDRPRPQIQKYHGAHQTHVLARSLLDDMKRLSQANGATLFMALLTVFKLLLARYTRSEDILVATPVAGRTRIETENLIGFFVNTLVLRTNCSNDPSFTELLARVRATCLEAYAHQDMPFEKLVEELKPDRSLSYAPLVQVMFGQRLAGARKLALRGLDVTRIELARESATFDLYMGVTETEAGLHLSVEYNTDLFDAASIARLLNHYENLLRGILRNPNARLSELPLLAEVEQNQLLLDWNETHADYPQHATVQALFEAQVEKTPDAIALVFQNEELTYVELNKKANRLAHHLIALGVGPEVLVGICVERSLDMIVGLLAILKAGGAYVPLDPAYPKERLAFMLEDSKASVLITRGGLTDKLPAHPAQCVLIDQAEAFDRSPITNPTTNASPDGLAYVVYTSGSTGRPKGVAIEHRGLANLVTWHRRAYDVMPADRATQVAGIAFDASVWELWPYLCAGASIHIPGEEIRSVPQKLLDWLAAKRITLCFLPTPLAESLLDEQWPEQMALRALLTGGDRLHRAPPKALPFALINHYGPTENTVVTTSAKVITGHGESPPIGRPIANTQVYILDPHLKPVPIGIPGELHIGGAGLARGYLNRPELTAEKFIVNPFGDKPGARLYKTGDLARYLPDGNIQFLGRLDTQVKIRGFRIELGEIETALLDLSSIKEAAVTVWEDQPGDRRLIAYLVVNGRPAPSVGELRSFLKERLPDYMAPAAFVFLDALPLTPNGKVDRKALPAPDGARPEMEQALAAPRTPSEDILARIWAEVLRLDRIGVNDNFFELGGDSILSIQIVARASRAGLRLTPRHIFQHQTIAELASVAGTAPTIRPLHFPAAKLNQGQLDSLVDKFRRLRGSRKISAEEIEDVYPLSPTQRVMLLYNLCYPAGSGVYHQEFRYTLRGNLDVSLFERSWQQMVERHSILRTAFLKEPVQVVKRHVSLPLDYRDWRGLTSVEQQDQLEEFLKVDRRRRFEISEPPLMRLALFRLSQNHYQFIWISHHVLLDGWSRSVLWKEILACYEALSRGRQPDWQPAPPFRDYIVWLQQQQRRDSEAEAFWRALLKDFTTPTPLGADAASRASEQEKLYGKQQIQLSRAETAKLQAFARRHRVTLNTLAQAAWALLLSRYSGESDVLFGGVLSVRPSAILGVESMVGPLINTLPIRVQLTPRDSVGTFLKKLHEQQVEMSQYDYSSLAKVQEWSGVPRGRALFDSLFLFQNFPQGARRGQGGSFEISPDRSAGRTNCALAIVVRPGAELSLAIGFDADRFDKVTITRMLGDFQILLRAIVADPGRRVGDLGPLTDKEAKKTTCGRGF